METQYIKPLLYNFCAYINSSGSLGFCSHILIIFLTTDRGISSRTEISELQRCHPVIMLEVTELFRTTILHHKYLKMQTVLLGASFYTPVVAGLIENMISVTYRCAQIHLSLWCMSQWGKKMIYCCLWHRFVLYNRYDQIIFLMLSHTHTQGGWVGVQIALMMQHETILNLKIIHYAFKLSFHRRCFVHL